MTSRGTPSWQGDERKTLNQTPDTQDNSTRLAEWTDGCKFNVYTFPTLFPRMLLCRHVLPPLKPEKKKAPNETGKNKNAKKQDKKTRQASSGGGGGGDLRDKTTQERRHGALCDQQHKQGHFYHTIYNINTTSTAVPRFRPLPPRPWATSCPKVPFPCAGAGFESESNRRIAARAHEQKHTGCEQRGMSLM